MAYERSILSSVGLLTLLLSGTALAQVPDASSANTDNRSTVTGERSDDDEIVVTGTSIRGVAPAGAQSLGFSEEDIDAIGATTSAQLLANVPQLNGYFNETPTSLGNNAYQLTVNRPALRGLSGGSNVDATSASSTLLLMNGHRLVASGIKQTSPDADVIPPSILQRLEIVPDGGSSIYGADAVGGVVNYITLQRFDGVQIDARAGFADEYRNSDFTLTMGNDWGSGSAFIAYNNAQRDSLYGRERDFIQKLDWTTGVATERQCASPNITSNGQNYTLTGPGGAPALGLSVCDASDDVAYFPQESKDSAYARVTQDLTSAITFDLEAYYSIREDRSDGGPLRATVNLSDANPYRLTSLGAGTQQVRFSFEPLLGRSTTQSLTNEAWQITPSLTVDLRHDWQLRSFFSHGKSNTSSLNYLIDQSALNAAGAASNPAAAINPFNLAATNPSVIAGILNFRGYGSAHQELSNAKAIVDGPLFSLPGGEIRVAVGAEWLREGYDSRSGDIRADLLGALILREGTRDVNAVFAEINIPVVGPQNQFPGVHSLDVSLAARLDNYSDFGETTNPRVGITYEPFDWLALRGAWGESFQAPSLADVSAATTEISLQRNIGLPANPSVPLPADSYRVFLSGSKPGLRPQTATTWSTGFDIDVPFIENLQVSGTYYNIQFVDLLSRGLPLTTAYYTNFPTLYTMSPTAQQVAAGIAGAVNEADAAATLAANAGVPIYAIYDARVTNLGRVRTSGIDASVSYGRETSFGSMYVNVSGNYILNRQSSLSSSSPFGNNTASRSSRVNLTATVGATIGEHIRAQATLNHRGGFDVTPQITNNFQDEVDAFDLVNLYFQYDFQGQGLTEDLSLSLGINNAFDEDPPIYQGSILIETHGYANGFTTGRLFQIGLQKRF